MTTPREERERDLADRLAKWHKAQHGVLPDRVGAHICGDLAIVRTRGVWTAAEREILKDDAGRKLVTTARIEHRSLTRAETHKLVAEAVGCDVLRSFYDLDGRVGETCEVYVLEANLDRRLTADAESG